MRRGLPLAILGSLLVVFVAAASTFGWAGRVEAEARLIALASVGGTAADICGDLHDRPGHCPLCSLTEGTGQAVVPDRAAPAVFAADVAREAGPVGGGTGAGLRPPVRAPPAA